MARHELDGEIRRYYETFDEAARLVHVNPSGEPAYFTTAYFHMPRELGAELEQAGLRVETTLGVEGPLWLLGDLAGRWDDAEEQRRMLAVVRRLEAEPSLLGASAHLLAVARKR